MSDNTWIKAVINATDEIDFDKNADKVTDIIQLSDNSYQLLMDNRNYTLTILEQTDLKNCKILINGNVYTVGLKDRLDIMVDKLGLSAKTRSTINEIKAPMPGLVLDVLVQPGQEIHKGDSLLILEAMKMENVIKAGGDGVIDSIHVSKGDAVDKNHVMIKLV